jgi:hypothetical protein
VHGNPILLFYGIEDIDLFLIRVDSSVYSTVIIL